jgi:hypothetical protein
MKIITGLYEEFGCEGKLHLEIKYKRMQRANEGYYSS